MRRVFLVGVLLAGLAGLTGPGAAQTSPDPRVSTDAESDIALLHRTWYRSISYQTLSSLDDFGFGYFLGGGAAAGGVLVLANAVSELAVNYAHDLTWAIASRDLAVPEGDTRTTRTFTYTAMNTVRVFGLGILITGNAVTSLGYVAFNAVADAGVYAANDAAWDIYWPAPEPSQQSRDRAATLTLGDYLPEIQVIIRQAESPGGIFIKEVPSTEPSLSSTLDDLLKTAR